MLKEIVVFRKQKTDSDGKKFTVCFSKLGKENRSYNIKFNEDCVNKNLIPAGTKPFVLWVDTAKCSPSTKEVTVEKFNERTGEVTTETKTFYNLYIRAIENITEYVEPETDFENL